MIWNLVIFVGGRQLTANALKRQPKQNSKAEVLLGASGSSPQQEAP